MRKRLISIVLIMTLLFTSVSGNFIAFAETNKDEVIKVIVKHKEGKDDKYLPVAADNGVEKSMWAQKQTKTKKLNDTTFSTEAYLSDISMLSYDEDVEWIEYDRIVSIQEEEPVEVESIQLHNNTSLATGEGIKVAILDTGVDLDDSNLVVAGGVSFVGDNYGDNNGHGTKVASIIASTNPDIIGLSPEVELYSVKVLDENGKGYYSDVIAGIEWCIENRIDIIVMSFGADEYSGILHESAQKAYYQDILMIAAAGNASNSVDYPAALSEVISVGSVNEENQLVYEYDSYADIYTKGSSNVIDHNEVTSISSGTSISAAQVAGITAQAWSYDLTQTNMSLRDILITQSNDEYPYPVLDSGAVFNALESGLRGSEEDTSSEILDSENVDVLVGISAQWQDIVSLPIGQSFTWEVWFSQPHNDVLFTIYDKSDNSIVQSRTQNVSGSYDWDTNTYGESITISFSGIDAIGEYIVEVDVPDDIGDEYTFSDEFTVIDDVPPPPQYSDLVINEIKVGNLINSEDLMNLDIPDSQSIEVIVTNQGLIDFEGSSTLSLKLIPIEGSSAPEYTFPSVTLTSAPVFGDTRLYVDIPSIDRFQNGIYQLQAELTTAEGSNEENMNNNVFNYHKNLNVIYGYFTPAKTILLVGDPVDVANGSFTLSVTDLEVKGKSPLTVSRYYNGSDDRETSLGLRWRHSYDITYEMFGSNINVTFGDGSMEFIVRNENGTSSFDQEHIRNVSVDGSGQITLEMKNNTVYVLSFGKVDKMIQNGNELMFSYTSDNLSTLSGVGGSLQFNYTGNQLTSITDDANRTVQYEYVDGNLVSIINVNGHKWSYEYDSNRRIIHSIDPNGQIELANTYDTESRVINQINKDGTIQTYTYNTDNTVFTERNGVSLTYVLDEKGRVVQEIDPLGTQKKVYDENDNIIETVDRMGRSTEFMYDEYNNMIEKVDALNQSTKYEYDADSNVTKITYPDEGIVLFEYDSEGKLTKETDQLQLITKYQYDANNNLISKILPDQSVESYTYDERGNLLSVTNSDNITTEFTYDAINRLISIQNPEGGVTLYEYANNGDVIKKTRSNQAMTQNVYNNLNQVMKSIDEYGRETLFEYTSMGDASKVTYPDGTQELMGYDNVQNLLSFTDRSGYETQYEYDDLNRLVRVYKNEKNLMVYDYDLNGNLTKKVDANGNATVYQFDVLNRMVLEADPYGYATTYEYNAKNQITKITDALNQFVTMTYDKADQLISETDKNLKTTIYEYDFLGNLVRETFADNSFRAFKYDAVGNMIEVTRDQVTLSYEYDGNGNMIKETDALGFETLFTYDAVGNMTNEKRIVEQEPYFDERTGTFVVPNPIVYQKTYEYSLDGNLLKAFDEQDNVERYVYDTNGRVTSIFDKMGEETKYEYDALGNVINITEVNDEPFVLYYEPIGGFPELPLLNGDITESYSSTVSEDDLIPIPDMPEPDPVKYVPVISNGSIHHWFEYDQDGNLVKEYMPYYEHSIDDLDAYLSNRKAIIYSYDDVGNLLSQVDMEGNETKFKYDFNGKLIKTIRPDFSFVDYEYDKLSRLTKVIDGNGVMQSQSYDPNGNIGSSTDGNGNITSFEYDVFNQLVKVIDVNATSVSFESYEYNQYGNISRMKDKNDNWYSYEYDLNGKLTKETRPGGSTFEYSYDALSRLESTKDYAGSINNYDYDMVGNLRSRFIPDPYKTGVPHWYHPQDGDGIPTDLDTFDVILESYTHDAYGNVLTSYSIGNGEYANTYDRFNNLIKVIDSNGGFIHYEYDILGQLISVSDELNRVTSYGYDFNGNIKWEDEPGSERTNFSYDQVDNLTDITLRRWVDISVISAMSDDTDYTTSAVDITKTYSYDKEGHITKEVSATGLVVNYVYDGNYNLSMKIDEDGYITKYSYDINDSPIEIDYNNTKLVTFAYDNMGNVTSMTDELGTTSYTHDVFGRITSANDFANRTTQYNYNNNNLVTKITYPDSKVVNYTYSSDGRMLEVMEGPIKAAEMPVKNEYHGVKYYYDANNQLTKEQQYYYTMELVGSWYPPELMSIEENSEVLNAITDPPTDQPVWEKVEYEKYSSSYVYDSKGNLQSQMTQDVNNKVLLAETFSYDLRDNIITKVTQDALSGSTRTINYSYDSADQLIEELDPSGKDSKYFYDSEGNRVREESLDNARKNATLKVVDYVFNLENQLISSNGTKVLFGTEVSEPVTYSYDNRGNLLEVGTAAHVISKNQYDERGKLISNTNKMGIVSEYSYDGYGRRVKQVIDATNISVSNKSPYYEKSVVDEFLNGDTGIVKELNYVINEISRTNNILMVYGVGTESHKYIYGLNVVMIHNYGSEVNDLTLLDTSTPLRLNFVSDRMDSVRLILDDTLDIREVFDYKGFGESREISYKQRTPVSTNQMKYAGYVNDQVTTIYFVNARYYLPEIGRWNTKDLFYVDGLNLIIYVSNNPLKYLDPLGLLAEGNTSSDYVIYDENQIYAFGTTVYIDAGDGRLIPYNTGELWKNVNGKYTNKLTLDSNYDPEDLKQNMSFWNYPRIATGVQGSISSGIGAGKISVGIEILQYDSETMSYYHSMAKMIDPNLKDINYSDPQVYFLVSGDLVANIKNLGITKDLLSDPSILKKLLSSISKFDVFADVGKHKFNSAYSYEGTFKQYSAGLLVGLSFAIGDDVYTSGIKPSLTPEFSYGVSEYIHISTLIELLEEE